MFNTTFLGTRSASEAWPRIEELAHECNYSMAAIARKIEVSYPTIQRWFKANPKYRRELEKLKKKAHEQ